MMKKLSLIMLCGLLLAACGGSSSSPPRPLAIAEADATEVNAGEDTVHLSGLDSSSPNGHILSWQWRLLSAPEDSEAAIADADSPEASLAPDLPGDYVVRLVVNDGRADSADTQASRVTIKGLNPNPVAVAPNEITWILGTVQLDGAASRPPDGGDATLLVYDWQLLERPDGSDAELDEANQAYPRFTADEPGRYRAQLVVHYGERSSEPVQVEINIVEAKAPPVAKIAPLDGPVMRGDMVTLDGSGSEDPDGEPLQYRWRIANRPAGSSGEFLDSSETSVQATFIAESAAGVGRYVVELCVFNGVSRHCQSPGVFVNVEVESGTPNTPPVAVINPVNRTTWEVERGAPLNLSGGGSYDIDGDALSYEWEMLSWPAGFDHESGNNSLPACQSSTCWPGFTPTVDGEYVVQLTVSDGEASDSTTRTFTARLGANRPPNAVPAVVGGAQTVLIGTEVIFDGEASNDPDGNRMDYAWTLLDRPDNSEAVLLGGNTAFPILTPDQAGPYRVQLVVTDEHGWPSSARELLLMAKATNHPPVTRIIKESAGPLTTPEIIFSPQWDAEQPFAISRDWLETEYNTTPIEYRRDYFRLRADSYDPDGDPLSHLWSLVEAPTGNRMEVNETNSCAGSWHPMHSQETWQEYRQWVEVVTEWPCAGPRFSPSHAGRYVFEYSVYDGSEFAGPFTTTVHAIERDDYPSLLLEIVEDTVPHWNYRQATFPVEVRRLNAGTMRHGGPWDWSGPITLYNFRLTAGGGDYTLVDIETPSDNPDYVPRFMDMTNNQIVTDGYVISEGETIDVAWQVVVPEDEIPGNYSEQRNMQRNLHDANITGFFRVREREGWTLMIERVRTPYTSAGS